MYSSVGENSHHYNFFSEENSQKWKGLFITALQKVQRQVHPSLVLQSDALDYVEELILQNLLSTLCASQPHNVPDVEEHVKKTFPEPIDKWAIRYAVSAMEKGRKKSPLVLPVDKIHPLLVKDVLGYKIDANVSLYIVAVLDYIAADILKLTGDYVKNIKHQEISRQDVRVAMCADKVLMDTFFKDDDVPLSFEDEPVIRRESLTYEEIVKDFILEETQYIRDLNMIIKVFRAPFANLFPRSKDLDVIFSNILDIHAFTANLLSLIEEQMEATEENEVPLVGGCILEMSANAEFDIYETYVKDILQPNGRERLNTLLRRPDVNEEISKNGQGFREAVKYVLPKLLLGPIYHCMHYFEVLKVLMETTPDEEDRISLDHSSGIFTRLKTILEKEMGANMHKAKPWETSLRLHVRTGSKAAMTKMADLQKSIDGWEGKDICQSCSGFIMEGVLIKHPGRKPSDRHVFLFDSLIIFCKPNMKRSSVTGLLAEYKLKEKYMIRKLQVKDIEDTEEYKNAFELHMRDNPSMILYAKSYEEKTNWLAALISLQTRSMLERILDSILREEEKEHPLRLPDSENYRFGELDSEENIVFEDHHESSFESPVIKGGSLIKLVERLTYHMYADPNFVHTFLTTYRSFCSPQDLLDLLIERFDIPEPEVATDELDKAIVMRDDLKRFRKEYVKPVQFRVVNALRQWVQHHFYDFERDQGLLNKLTKFLETVKGKAMKKWAESITNVISRRLESGSGSTEIEFTYQQPLPAIEWYLVHEPEQFDIMTLHPIEIARQVTLLEFNYYRAVQPSELVGCQWIKKNKNQLSPNLLKMIHFSTMFTFWMEKCIVEAENFEERLAVVSRVLEVMTVFQELNNFNGVLEVVSALNSASVYRLEHTFRETPKKLLNAFEEAESLNADHFKKYIEKLRSINPPCVPFLGMYLTNIILIDEGNPDCLLNRPAELINFSKRRRVAEITGEIQQYQNQPYCLQVDDSIRSFFEELDPIENRTEKEFTDYLYEKSLEIEPRNAKQLPKFLPKRPYSLRSPGVRPMSSRHASVSSSRTHMFHLSSEARAAGYNRIDEELEIPSPTTTTPPTPSTPMTPCSDPDGGGNSVFGSVFMGGDVSTSQMSLMTSSTSLGYSSQTLSSHGGGHISPSSSMSSLAEAYPLLPPPVPPRRPIESVGSLSDISINRQSSTGSGHAPAVPPRDTPPPVPPRRDVVFSSLPRLHNSPTSVRSFSTVPHSSSSSGVFSEYDSSSVSSVSVVNINGDGLNFTAGSELPRKSTLVPMSTSNTVTAPSSSPVFLASSSVPEIPPKASIIPELPPKTYRGYAHSRKQSS